MTKKEVEESPPLEADHPISEDYEIRFANYYGYPYYWAGRSLWMDHSNPGSMVGLDAEEIQKAKARKNEENHLRSVKEVEGYRIKSIDGDIGHVEDFIVDEFTWSLRYVIVDTRNWLPGGKKVLISMEWTSAIRWPERIFSVDLTKGAIENPPEFDPSAPIKREYELRLYDYYCRPYTQVRSNRADPAENVGSGNGICRGGIGKRQ